MGNSIKIMASVFLLTLSFDALSETLCFEGVPQKAECDERNINYKPGDNVALRLNVQAGIFKVTSVKGRHVFYDFDLKSESFSVKKRKTTLMKQYAKVLFMKGEKLVTLETGSHAPEMIRPNGVVDAMFVDHLGVVTLIVDGKIHWI